ncbi:MAG: glycosyltransferase family 39 protein [Acidimicrobiales bacterium]
MDPVATNAIRLRSLARPLAAITALNVALLLTWSVMVPTFRGADEHVHHDFIRYLAGTWSYPEYDGLAVSRRTLAALGTSPVIPADAPPAPTSAATHRADRPGWADLGPDVRDGPPNQMPQHPPLYYESAAAALRVLDSDGQAPLDLAVWMLRLLNVLAMAPLPLLAADVARRYTQSVPVVLTSAVGMVAVPQLTHVGATVSNDPLMILLGSLTLLGAARLATGDRRWGIAVGTGVAAGLGLFTKGFAVPLVPAVGLACLLPLTHRDATRRGAWAPLARAAIVATIAFALGGWWWIRNVLEYQTPQPGVRLRSRVEDVDLDLVRFAGDFTERLLGSFWGNFGWHEAHLPIGISYTMTAVVIAAVVIACWRAWPRVMLVLPAIAAAAMVLSSGWGAFKKTGVSYATQGRYLFAGAVGLAVLVSLGLDRAMPRRAHRAPLVVLGVAVTLQGIGLWVCGQRYWAGGVVDRMRAMIRFAPLPGPVTAGFLLTAAAATVAAVWALWVAGRTEIPENPPIPAPI